MAPSPRRRWSCTSLGLRTRSRRGGGTRARRRAAPPLPPLRLTVLGGGQLDDEAGAARRSALHGDGSAVALDDLAHDGEPDARPRGLGGQEELEDPLPHLGG